MRKLKAGAYQSSLGNLFDNEIAPNCCLQAVLYYDEDKSKGKMISLLSSLFSRYTPNFLKQRKIFIREKGVVVCLKTFCEEINSFLIKEIHEGYHHLILLQTRCGSFDVKKNLIVDIENINFVINKLNLYSDCDAVLWLICWLGLKDVLLNCDWFEHCENSELAGSVELMIQAIAHYVGEENLYYEEPPSWNYESHSTGAKKSVSTAKVQR